MHGNLYATPKAPVAAALEAGEDVLFDIDWQGARQLEERLGADVVLVFILPPGGKVLEQRLKARNQDTADIVARRLAAAANEIEHWLEYDYVHRQCGPGREPSGPLRHPRRRAPQARAPDRPRRLRARHPRRPVSSSLSPFFFRMGRGSG